MKNKLLITLGLLFIISSCNVKPIEKDDNIVNFDFYTFNDTHGTVYESNEAYGIAKDAAYIKAQNDKNKILLSAGDMWQGSAESNMTRGSLMTDWMNEMKFSAMCLGNHEFDWTMAAIEANCKRSEFPILGVNVFSDTTHSHFDFIGNSTVVQKDNVNIGIIGAIGDVFSSISVKNRKGFEFAQKDDFVRLIKEESTRLKEKDKCDFIILLWHYDCHNWYDNSLSNGYVDLVFEGHTHSEYNYVDNYGVHHIQGKGYNNSFSHTDVDFDVTNKSIKVNSVEFVDYNFLQLYKDDEATLKIINNYDSVIGNARSVAGKNVKNRNSKELGELIAKLYIEKAKEIWGDKYKIFLGGGSLNARSPYSLKAGNVTYADLYNLFPFDNNLQIGKISGKNLKNNFIENSQFKIAFTEYGEANKNKINDNEDYYIVVDDYTGYYEPNKITVMEMYEENIFSRDLLLEYCKKGGFEK